MTITLEISPETEVSFARQAAMTGLGVNAYAASLLEAAGASSTPLPSNGTAANLVELFAPIRGFNLEFERDRDPGRDVDLG